MKFLYILYSLLFFNCSSFPFFSKPGSLVEFDYQNVSKNYYNPSNEKPFPLTVKRGNNLYGRISKDNKFLYYAGDSLGNLNIYLRDLNSSVTFPLTLHPSADYKPSISPDGKRLAFVSERIDSEGDILIANIDPVNYVNGYLKGNTFADSFQIINITNPEYSTKNIIKRNIDTDPVWSPDGRYLAFVSDRDSKGTTNIYLSDTKNNYNIQMITKYGASSPSYSPDGKFIYYISYRDNPEGEIYKIEISTKIETRITNDNFMDLNPSITDDGNFLIYTSIREDSNKNGKLNSRDNGYIIKKDLKTSSEINLNSGNYSLFDTQYSSFIGGSVIYSASFDNSINIYFLPISGEIPKERDIQRQYELSDKYRNRSSEYVKFAYKSIENFFNDDTFFPLYKSRADRQILRDMDAEGNEKGYKNLLHEMISKKNDPQFGFSYALALSHEALKNNKNIIPNLYAYIDEIQNIENIHPQIAPSILNLIGEIYEESGNIESSEPIYQKIILEYPKFYRIEDVKLSLGIIELKKNKRKIPEYFIEIFSENLNRRNYRIIISEIQKIIENESDIKSQKELIQNYLNENILEKNPDLYSLISLFYARLLKKEDQFAESNEVILKVLEKSKAGGYANLGSLYLLYENFRDLNDENNSIQSLLKFLNNYNPRSNFIIEQDSIESTLISFEGKAKKSELLEEYENSIKFYINNSYFLSLAQEKKLPIGSIISDYSTYYNKKMIDNAIKISQGKDESGLESILSDANILTGNKINILGKTTQTLSSLLDFKIIRFFGDFRDLNFTKTIDEDIFKDIDQFYESRKKIAQKNLDLGTIYGYSYYLISKSVAKEKIFTEKKVLTESKKKSILKDLKEAELNLQWILYANPNFSEAYLLLGWLYQYIDIRKNSIPEGESKKEEELFEDLYLTYFPLKYLEENVELYSQILDFLKNSENKKLKSDLNLNLGNTFFLLNDYENALKHYSIVNDLSNSIIPNVQFENYRQKAFYFYNFARAHIYSGDLEKAIPFIQNSMEIYYKEEYFPLISKIGTKNEKKEFLTNLENTRNKLALLHTLKGLAELELNKFHNAIFSFTTALSMNGERKFINDLGLYNSLALCYQKIGDYVKSEEILKKSEEEFLKKQSRLKKILSYSIWDTLFPENLRVIGDGRFPGELTSEYHNLITRGIRIQNKSDNKEYTDVLKSLESRVQFLKSNSLDKETMGKKIQDRYLIDIAQNEFYRGNYLVSSDYFTGDYDEKSKKGNLSDAFNSYLRSDIALFSHLEEKEDSVKKLNSEIEKNLSFLNHFKKEKIKECDNQIEKDKFKIDYCDTLFLKNYPLYEISLANNYFYAGELQHIQRNLELSSYYFSLASHIAGNPGNIQKSEIGLTTDPFSMKERCRLKITSAISQLRLGNDNKFLEELREAFYIASEFQFDKETLNIYLIEAEYYYSKAKTNIDYKKSIDTIKKIESLLKNQIGLWLTLDDYLFKNIYTLYNYNLIKLKNYEEAFETNEKLFSALAFKKLLTNEFRFQDEKIFQNLNELQFLTQKDKEYQEIIENAIINKKDIKSLLDLRQKNLDNWNNKVKVFCNLLPKNLDILHWMEGSLKNKLDIDKNSAVLEIYKNSENVVLVLKQRNNFTEVLNVKNEKIEMGIEEILENKKDVQNLILLPAIDFYNIQFQKCKYKNELLGDHFNIRYIYRESHLKRVSDAEYSRLRRISSTVRSNFDFKNTLEKIGFSSDSKHNVKEINLRNIPSSELKNYLSDTDILEGPLDFTNSKLFLGEKKDGTIDIKEVIESQWNIPLLIVNNFEKNETNYLKAGFYYDILIFSGVQSILFLDSDANTKKIRNSIVTNIKESNEIIKKEKLTLIGDKISPYPENQKLFESEFYKYTELGRKEERNRNYLESIKYFLLANSVLPDARLDLQIESEVNILRLKKRFYTDFNFLESTDKLLNIFSDGGKEEATILFHSLLLCYEDTSYTDCDKYYNLFLKNKNSSEDERLVINYYKAINENNLKYILENKNSFNKIKYFKDAYLTHLNLSNLYSGITLWKEAFEEVQKAIASSNNNQELEIANNLKSEIYFEYFFINGIDLIVDQKEKPIYYAKNKLWNKYNNSLADLLGKEKDYFKKEYIYRIYKSYEELENSPDFKPISLSPILMKNEEPSIFLLKDIDRMFLFHLLQKAIPYQKGSELNNQFDILINTELKLKNPNRAQWMQLQWSLSLLSRGDRKSALQYFKDLESLISDNFNDINFYNYYNLLKYKLSKIDSDIQFTEKDRSLIKTNFTEWYSYYEIAENITSEKDFYNLIDKIQKDKKDLILDSFNRRELVDLINFILSEALVQKNWDLILNLIYHKEKIDSVNEKFFTKPKISDIPQIDKNVSSNIRRKLPKNQFFYALGDIGIETYKISINNNQINGELVFNDNRLEKNLILDYLNSVKDFGESILQQKYIEEIYRKALNLNPNKISYIYFPSYHFKVYLTPNESDHFYYTLNLSLFSMRNLSRVHKDFRSPYNIKITSNAVTQKEKILLKIIEMETRLLPKSVSGKEINLSLDLFECKNEASMEFGGKPMKGLKENKLKKGIWILGGGKYSNSSIKSSDINHSIHILDEQFEGPGIVSTGIQNDTNTAYFIKEFLKKNGTETFFERYTDSMANLRKKYKEDKYWNGIRSYTNQILIE